MGSFFIFWRFLLNWSRNCGVANLLGVPGIGTTIPKEREQGINQVKELNLFSLADYIFMKGVMS